MQKEVAALLERTHRVVGAQEHPGAARRLRPWRISRGAMARAASLLGAEAIVRGYISQRRRARRWRTTLSLALYDGANGARVARFQVRANQKGIPQSQLQHLEGKLVASLNSLSRRNEERTQAKAQRDQNRLAKQDRPDQDLSARSLSQASPRTAAAEDPPLSLEEELDKQGQVIDSELPW